MLPLPFIPTQQYPTSLCIFGVNQEVESQISNRWRKSEPRCLERTICIRTNRGKGTKPATHAIFSQQRISKPLNYFQNNVAENSHLLAASRLLALGRPAAKLGEYGVHLRLGRAALHPPQRASPPRPSQHRSRPRPLLFRWQTSAWCECTPPRRNAARGEGVRRRKGRHLGGAARGLFPPHSHPHPLHR